jgi:hypothetical protein
MKAISDGHESTPTWTERDSDTSTAPGAGRGTVIELTESRRDSVEIAPTLFGTDVVDFQQQSKRLSASERRPRSGFGAFVLEVTLDQQFTA